MLDPVKARKSKNHKVKRKIKLKLRKLIKQNIMLSKNTLNIWKIAKLIRNLSILLLTQNFL
jgi:hypothetical protein